MEIFTAIGIVLALIGVPLAWFGIHRHRKHGERYARAIASWRNTRATVIDARLVDHESTDSDGDSSTWYEPKLHYRYKVGDATLEGRQTALCAAPRFSLLDRAQKWLLAHAPGTEIDVWYDPEHPEDSTPALDKPSVLSAAIILFVGAAFVVIGGVMVLGII